MTRPPSLPDVRVPLLFRPGSYRADRRGHFVTLDTVPAAAAPAAGGVQQRSWPVGEPPWQLRIDTTAANGVESLYLWAAELQVGEPPPWPRDAEPVHDAGLELTLPFFNAQPAMTIFEHIDGTWHADLHVCGEATRWWLLDEDIAAGATDDGMLAAVRLRGAPHACQPRTITFDPDDRLHLDGYLAGDVLQLYAERVRFEEEDDDAGEASEGDDAQELAGMVDPGFQRSLDAWLAGGPPPAQQQHAGTGAGAHPGDIDELQDACLSPDGGIEMYARDDRIDSLAAQAEHRPVPQPEHADELLSPLTLTIDLSGGARSSWMRVAGEETADALLELAPGAAVEDWLEWSDLLVGVGAGNRLVALLLPGVPLEEAEEDDVEAEEHDAAHGLLEAVERFRERALLRDWDAVSRTPPFPVIGIARWDGPVHGGPDPDAEEPDVVMLRYWAPDDRDRPEAEVEARREPDYREAVAPGAVDENAMWVAEHLFAAQLRTARSEGEARRLVAELDGAARELATRDWTLTTIPVDGVPQTFRLLEEGDAWVARGRVQRTYLTVRAWRVDRSQVELTELADLGPFIEGAQQLEQQHLAYVEQSVELSPEQPGSPEERHEAETIANRFAAALEGGETSLTHLLADGIADRHGGDERYRKLLSVYQAAALSGGGWGSSGARISEDGERASVPLHLQLPGSGRTDRVSVVVAFADQPEYEEPSDDDVTVADGMLEINLQLVRQHGEWRVQTDVLGDLMRVLGTPDVVVLPREPDA